MKALKGISVFFFSMLSFCICIHANEASLMTSPNYSTPTQSLDEAQTTESVTSISSASLHEEFFASEPLISTVQDAESTIPPEVEIDPASPEVILNAFQALEQAVEESMNFFEFETSEPLDEEGLELAEVAVAPQFEETTIDGSLESFWDAHNGVESSIEGQQNLTEDEMSLPLEEDTKASPTSEKDSTGDNFSYPHDPIYGEYPTEPIG